MADMSIVIVPYEPDHLARIVEITIEGFRGVSIDHLVEERFGRVDPGWEERKASDIRRAARAEPEGIFVALDGERVVGFVTVDTNREKLVGRIADLAVDTGFRRKGVATRLIERGVRYMEERGMRFAKIETLANNEAGLTAYPRMGFQEIARQVHYVMPIGRRAPGSTERGS